jgi:hypothetical protein
MSNTFWVAKGIVVTSATIGNYSASQIGIGSSRTHKWDKPGLLHEILSERWL